MTEKMVLSLDDKDHVILEELQRNAKATTGRIAKRTGIPTTTVHNRIKRFEREGVIVKYEPVLDYERLGKPIHALIFITAASHLDGKAVDQRRIGRQALTINGILGARIITGTFDLILDVRVPDVRTLNEILITKLRAIEGVEKTQTTLVLEDL